LEIYTLKALGSRDVPSKIVPSPLPRPYGDSECNRDFSTVDATSISARRTGG